jgi:hypothetical protein
LNSLRDPVQASCWSDALAPGEGRARASPRLGRGPRGFLAKWRDFLAAGVR